MKKAAHQEIADAFAKKVPMSTKTSFSGSDLVGELAPMLMRILSPDVKLVSILSFVQNAAHMCRRSTGKPPKRKISESWTNWLAS